MANDPLEAIVRRSARVAMHRLLTDLGYAHESYAMAYHAREGARPVITEERLEVLIRGIVKPEEQ